MPQVQLTLLVLEPNQHSEPRPTVRIGPAHRYPTCRPTTTMTCTRTILTIVSSAKSVA
jgi:hypothetical protein